MRGKHYHSRFSICLLHLVYKGLCENFLSAMGLTYGDEWVKRTWNAIK
jgi:hypothetical protein